MLQPFHRFTRRATTIMQDVPGSRLCPTGIDVLEICGGDGRPNYVAVRRQLSAGNNIDAAVRWGIHEPQHQHAIIGYIHRHKPLLILMGHSWRHHNATEASQQCRQAARQALPHGLFCAELCWLQLEGRRFFWAEQPRNATILNFGRWPELLAKEDVFQARFDQCVLGLTDQNGLPLRRPSAGITNSAEMYELFNGIRCDGTHMHGSELTTALVCPWRIANLLTDGLIQLRRKTIQAYPAGSSTDSAPSAAAATPAAAASSDDPLSIYNRECVACRCHWPKGDPAHTRVPDKCRFPLDQEEQWDCPGCINHRPLSHPDHTYDPLTCRATVALGRRGRPRQGRHPRQPAAKPSDSEVRDLQAQLPLEQGDLGAQEEQHAANAAAAAPAAAAGGHGGGGRTAVRNASSGNPVVSDWTRFDVQSSLAVLRTGTTAMKLRMLRKLHLRWWHASAHTMSHVLSSAGIGPRVLELLPQVTDTCRQCLEWARPGVDTRTSSHIADKPGDELEVDLLFFKKSIIAHAVCRCSRYHAAIHINSKEAPDIIEGLNKCWFQHFGFPSVLIIDGEGSISVPEVGAEFRAEGTRIQIRAPGQHARHIERRGAVLRDCLHKLDAQARREGRDVTLGMMLGAAVFAGNCLTAVHGTTPYHRMFGRQPSMLPPLQADESCANADGSTTETQRQWVRHLALTTVIQQTAVNKIIRADKAFTRADHEVTVGQMVDYFRPPSSKGTSGWKGPVKVVKLDLEDGHVVCSINGRNMPCRIQDIRPTAMFAMMVFVSSLGRPSPAWNTILGYLSTSTPGSVLMLGMNYRDGEVTCTTFTPPQQRLLSALLWVAQSELNVPHPTAFRIGRGVARFDSAFHAASSLIAYWPAGRLDQHQLYTSSPVKISMVTLIGPQYRDDYMLQALSALSPLHVISEDLHPALLVPASQEPPSDQPAPDAPPQKTPAMVAMVALRHCRP